VILDPEYANAFVGIGAVHTRRFFAGWEGGAGNLEDAGRNFRRALELDPSLVAAYRGLIRIAWERGDFLEGLELGKQVGLTGKQDVDTLFVRAEAYLFSGLPWKAGRVLQAILELDPANKGAYWMLVIAHAWAGQYTEAIDAGEVYLELFDFNDIEIHNWMSQSYFLLGDLESAEMHSARVLRLFDEKNHRVDILKWMGVVYQGLGQPDMARETWERARRLYEEKLDDVPDNFRIWAQLASVYGFLGDIGSMRELEQRLENAPYPGSQYYTLAVDNALLGNHDRALEILERVEPLGAFRDDLNGLLVLVGAEEFLLSPEFLEYDARAQEAAKILEETY